MELIQKNITVNLASIPSPSHPQQTSGDVLINPPVGQKFQTFEAQGILGGRTKENLVAHSSTPQIPPNASEHMTATQLETIIDEKIKAAIVSEQAEKLVRVIYTQVIMILCHVLKDIQC